LTQRSAFILEGLCGPKTVELLVHELFAANICGAIVRGWASTVSADEDGYASPRFERKATADLWREIVANRFGVRDRREA